MSVVFSYKDLKKSMLSYQALALLSEFALIWYTRSGELINLDDDDVVMRIFRTAKRCNDRRLKCICLHLRTELSCKIERSMPHCDAILADQLLTHVTNGRVCTRHNRTLSSNN